MDTWVDLVLFDMLDCDIILDIDWLVPYHVVLDCYANTNE